MFDNIITFSANKEFIKNNQDILPVLTKTNIPDWYKKLTHSYEAQTVKGCMPFLDTLTCGYILKIATDYKIRHNVEFEGKKRSGFDSAQQMMNSLAEKINMNYQGKHEFHSIDQVKGSPYVEKNKNLPFHKILNPWTIITPPGYSCLFVSPLNNSDDRFTIMPGIVDTDKYPQEVNFPYVINGDKYESLKTILKKGTPYAQVIPFKRDAWKMKIEKISGRESYFQKLFYRLKYLATYQDKFWSKKRCK